MQHPMPPRTRAPLCPAAMLRLKRRREAGRRAVNVRAASRRSLTRSGGHAEPAPVCRARADGIETGATLVAVVTEHARRPALRASGGLVPDREDAVRALTGANLVTNAARTPLTRQHAGVRSDVRTWP